MNKLKEFIITIFILFIIIMLFKYNYILDDIVINSFNIWLKRVFPTLFIMFILNDLIIKTNIINNITKYFKNIFNKIYNTNNYSVNAFLLSIFSGTPANSYIIKELLNNNLITINDANTLITFTYFSNPLFLYNILTKTFNSYITIKIIIIHYISNIFIGMFFRKKHSINNFIINRRIHYNLLKEVPKSINKSFNTLLMILGTITFYMIITNIIIIIIKPNILFEILIKGLFEITQALNILNKLNIVSILKEIIALSIISFGGLSIHSQIYSIISDTKISYKYFFVGRIYHILISISIYLIIYTVTQL